MRDRLLSLSANRAVRSAQNAMLVGSAIPEQIAGIFTNSLRILLKDTQVTLYQDDTLEAFLKRLMLQYVVSSDRKSLELLKEDLAQRAKSDLEAGSIAEHHGHRLLWAWHTSGLAIKSREYPHHGYILSEAKRGKYSAKAVVFSVDQIVRLARHRAGLILDAEYTPTGSLLGQAIDRQYAH